MNSGQQIRFLTLSLAIVVSVCCSETELAAQGDFGGFQASSYQTRSAQVPQTQRVPQTFQPPAANHAVARPAVSSATQAHSQLRDQPVLARPEAAWPDQPVQYDDFVKQANLERSAGSSDVNNLIGSTVDSAGELFGSWKDKIGEKTNQMLGSGDSESAGLVGGNWLSTIKEKASSPDIQRMLGSLALVVGGYLALVVLLRKFGGGGQRGIPAEVVSVLGNLPYGHKQNLRLVRLGSKLVLLLNGPDGTHPIGEITDPGEVEYLASLCQGKRAVRSPASLAAPLTADTNARGITEESLTQVLRRLEQATRGGTASYEA